MSRLGWGRDPLPPKQGLACGFGLNRAGQECRTAPVWSFCAYLGAYLTSSSATSYSSGCSQRVGAGEPPRSSAYAFEGSILSASGAIYRGKGEEPTMTSGSGRRRSSSTSGLGMTILTGQLVNSTDESKDDVFDGYAVTATFLAATGDDAGTFVQQSLTAWIVGFNNKFGFDLPPLESVNRESELKVRVQDRSGAMVADEVGLEWPTLLKLIDSGKPLRIDVRPTEESRTRVTLPASSCSEGTRIVRPDSRATGSSRPTRSVTSWQEPSRRARRASTWPTATRSDSICPTRRSWAPPMCACRPSIPTVRMRQRPTCRLRSSPRP